MSSTFLKIFNYFYPIWVYWLQFGHNIYNDIKKINGGGAYVGMYHKKNTGFTLDSLSEEGRKEVLRYAEFIKEKESGNAR